jgi:hypothetical protein
MSWALGPAVLLAGLLLLPAASASGGHYVPRAGDGFAYAETITLTNGTGNYTGYTESQFYNGSIAVTAVQPNGTESATYQAAGTYRNNQGQSSPWSEQGSFTFSADSFHYVQGTDNQTGYVNPHVWFYMDNTLGPGANFFILNSPVSVVSTSAVVATAASSTGYARAIFAEGNGSYQRNDVYGTFPAAYQWKAFYDPGTGYIVGYVYSEHDTNSAGDGFDWTDRLTDTHTSFPLTTSGAPGGPGPAPGPGIASGLVILGVVVLVLIVLVVVAIVYWVRRSRGGVARAGLPPHAAAPGTLPAYAPPPPIALTPRDEPGIQQVVVREVVKVPCRYCGTLIDSTATVCPKCGAPRT